MYGAVPLDKTCYVCFSLDYLHLISLSLQRKWQEAMKYLINYPNFKNSSYPFEHVFAIISLKVIKSNMAHIYYSYWGKLFGFFNAIITEFQSRICLTFCVSPYVLVLFKYFVKKIFNHPKLIIYIIYTLKYNQQPQPSLVNIIYQHVLCYY